MVALLTFFGPCMYAVHSIYCIYIYIVYRQRRASILANPLALSYNLRRLSLAAQTDNAFGYSDDATIPEDDGRLIAGKYNNPANWRIRFISQTLSIPSKQKQHLQ